MHNDFALISLGAEMKEIRALLFGRLHGYGLHSLPVSYTQITLLGPLLPTGIFLVFACAVNTVRTGNRRCIFYGWHSPGKEKYS